MNCPESLLLSAARRHGLVAAAAASLAFLVGCASPPPPPPPAAPPARFSPAQVGVLRDLGFVEVTGGWELNLAGKVLFSFNGEQLDAASARTVAGIADTLLKADLTRLRVEGHTDNVGEADYNRRLSTRRAEMVARDLAARGLPAAHMEVRGQGMSMPVADNTTEAGRAQNRRVTILVRGD
jgi:outer membrane protein OmpA-like peptidoglycan-associated protein